MYDYSFVEGLSKLNSVMKGKDCSLQSITLLKETLKDEYCFYTEFEDSSRFNIEVTVPQRYSDIELDWVYECYKCYLPAGIGLTVVRGDIYETMF